MTARDAEKSLIASRFELASGGTVFLDAVHELSAAQQHEMQELLDRQERARAAGATSSPDTRVIASTLPASGRPEISIPFLESHQLVVPALKDRRDDIPALVDYFVGRHARQFGKTIDGVSAESMQRLQDYAWPGNIRELATVLERAVLVAPVEGCWPEALVPLSLCAVESLEGGLAKETAAP